MSRLWDQQIWVILQRWEWVVPNLYDSVRFTPQYDQSCFQGCKVERRSSTKLPTFHLIGTSLSSLDSPTNPLHLAQSHIQVPSQAEICIWITPTAKMSNNVALTSQNQKAFDHSFHLQPRPCNDDHGALPQLARRWLLLLRTLPSLRSDCAEEISMFFRWYLTIITQETKSSTCH